MEAGSQNLTALVLCRWNQAHKSSGTNFQGLPSKIDTLKEEMDEAGNKVEQCKVREHVFASVFWFLQLVDERSYVATCLIFYIISIKIL